MKQACERATYIKDVRSLARSFSAAELNRCLAAQIDRQMNGCAVCAVSSHSVDLLARAVYVKTMVEEKGVTVKAAMRELGRKMRSVQQMKA